MKCMLHFTLKLNSNSHEYTERVKWIVEYLRLNNSNIRICRNTIHIWKSSINTSYRINFVITNPICLGYDDLEMPCTLLINQDDVQLYDNSANQINIRRDVHSTQQTISIMVHHQITQKYLC